MNTNSPINVVKRIDRLLKKKCNENFKEIYAIVIINVFNEEEYLTFTTTRTKADKLLNNFLEQIDSDFNVELKIKKLSGKMKGASSSAIKKRILNEGERFNKGMNPFE